MTPATYARLTPTYAKWLRRSTPPKGEFYLRSRKQRATYARPTQRLGHDRRGVGALCCAHAHSRIDRFRRAATYAGAPPSPEGKHEQEGC